MKLIGEQHPLLQIQSGFEQVQRDSTAIIGDINQAGVKTLHLMNPAEHLERIGLVYLTWSGKSTSRVGVTIIAAVAATI